MLADINTAPELIARERFSNLSPAASPAAICRSLERLDAWIEAEGFRGWDPYDALNSPLLGPVGRRNRLLGIAIVQLVRRSPVNLRPLLGIRKGYNPKAMGLFLASYAQKFLATQKPEYLEQVRFFFSWLAENASPGYAGPCWGYNFDWPNRSFLAPAGTPTIVNTSFIGLGLLRAEAALGRIGDTPMAATPSLEREEVRRAVGGLRIARGACDFILHDLHALSPTNEETCFSYTPLDRRFVHNANVLGAWLLAAVYARSGEKHLSISAKAAARFTARRQSADGSWPYGIAANDQWIDNFHTGFNLVALKNIAKLLQTQEFDAAIRAGYRFWKAQMFECVDIPKYFPHQTYPIDIHSVAQAILTFLEFTDMDPEAEERAAGVAQWAMRNLQDRAGFFYYRCYRRLKIKIPYMRWSQAWIQHALTRLTCAQPALFDERAAFIGGG